MTSIKKILILSSTLLLFSCTEAEINQLDSILNGVVSGGNASSYTNGQSSLDKYTIVRHNHGSIIFDVVNDRFGYVKEVKVGGYLRNDRPYPVKLVVEVPMRDRFQKIIHTFKLEKNVSAYQTINLSSLLSKPEFKEGYVNINEIKSSITRIDTSTTPKNNDVNKTTKANEISYDVVTDNFGYAREIRLRGKIYNMKAYPKKLLVSIPLVDDYGRTVHVIKYDRNIPNNTSISINETIRVPNYIDGFFYKNRVAIEVKDQNNSFDYNSNSSNYTKYEDSRNKNNVISGSFKVGQ